MFEENDNKTEEETGAPLENGGTVENTTVFVRSIPFEASESDIVQFFSSCGNILSTKLLLDPQTRRFKGSCFLRFETIEGADSACKMNETSLMGRKLYISMSINKPASSPSSPHIFIGNLDPASDIESLREFFSKCGEVLRIKLITDKVTQRNKGFGFVEFADMEAAKNSLALNGTMLGSRPIRIDFQRSKNSQTLKKPRILPVGGGGGVGSGGIGSLGSVSPGSNLHRGTGGGGGGGGGGSGPGRISSTIPHFASHHIPPQHLPPHLSHHPSMAPWDPYQQFPNSHHHPHYPPPHSPGSTFFSPRPPHMHYYPPPPYFPMDPAHPGTFPGFGMYPVSPLEASSPQPQDSSIPPSSSPLPLSAVPPSSSPSAQPATRQKPSFPYLLPSDPSSPPPPFAYPTFFPLPNSPQSTSFSPEQFESGI